MRRRAGSLSSAAVGPDTTIGDVVIAAWTPTLIRPITRLESSCSKINAAYSSVPMPDAGQHIGTHPSGIQDTRSELILDVGGPTVG